jgi:uncharacterized protein (DUF2461 family)
MAQEGNFHLERGTVLGRRYALRQARPPRGFDASHPFIDDLKMRDLVASVALSEDQICSDKLMRDFVSACRKMSPLVEFTTKALGLKF